MKINKSQFVAVSCFSVCLIIVYYILIPSNVLKSTDRKIHVKPIGIFHRETKHGKFCIEENICKNDTQQTVYMYIRQTNFYDLITKDVNLSKSAVNAERIVPNIVHYTWYGGLKKGNNFRFHHMLAILSAHKFIKPSRIYFWHDMVPVGDYWTEVNKKVPELCLVYRKSPTEIRGRKVSVPEHLTDVVRLEAVMEYGGMYFDLDVMVLKPLDQLLKYDVTMGYETPGGLCNGIIIGKAWAEFLKVWHKEYKSFQDSHWNYHSVQLPHKLATKYPNLIHTELTSLHRPNWQETDMLYGIGKLYDWRKNNYACHLWIRFHKIEHNAEDIKTWNTTVGEMWRWIYYGDWKLQLSATDGSKPSSPKNHCILGNICKDERTSRIFKYKRQADFLKIVDSSVDLKINVEHPKRVVPNIVHFSWYNGLKKYDNFMFHHLVSVLSAHKFIKADHILFWHDTLPKGDYWTKLTEKVPGMALVYRKTPTEIRGRNVTAPYPVRHVVGLEAVMEFGGIYLDFDVVVLKPLDAQLKFDVTMGYRSEDEFYSGIIMSKAWGDFLKLWYKEYNTYEDNKWEYHSIKLPAILAKKYPNLIHTDSSLLHGPNSNEIDQLYTERKLYNWRDKNYALHLWIRNHKPEHSPSTIKYWNTTVGEIFRYIYYGDGKLMEVSETKGKICIYGNLCKDKESDSSWKYIRLPTFMIKVDSYVNLEANITHSERIVPNIVHFTWYGGLKKGNNFRFHHLLAVLAAHKFLKPERILFWHDMVPDGPYWKEVNEKVPELNLVYRVAPNEIRGRRVAVSEHLTDVVRLEAVIEFGGMYFDLDAMVVKSLDPVLNYDVTMGYETPDGLCNGIMISKPWSEFFRIWHGEYRTFDDQKWAYHSVTLPAILAKKYPHLIHTESESMHRPNWMEIPKLYEKGKIYDWRTKNYAVHLWIRFHKVEHNATDIKTWNTTVGQIFRHIYYDDWKIQSLM